MAAALTHTRTAEEAGVLRSRRRPGAAAAAAIAAGHRLDGQRAAVAVAASGRRRGGGGGWQWQDGRAAAVAAMDRQTRVREHAAAVERRDEEQLGADERDVQGSRLWGRG